MSGGIAGKYVKLDQNSLHFGREMKPGSPEYKVDLLCIRWRYILILFYYYILASVAI
jgi:hypothetical protein